MRKKFLSKIIFGVLFSLAVMFLIGFLSMFTRNFTTGFETFYVVYDGVFYMGSGNKVEFDRASVRFDCRYTLDFLAVEKPSGYTVRVLPNVSAADDFVFYVDGAPHLFSKILDLSVAFDIDGQGDYFIMSVDKSMSEVLQSLYSDSEVVMSSVLTAAHLYFLLEVIPDNGASVVYIEFNNVVPVQSVILDINQINF